jgi:hypothetical protein
VLLAPGRRGAGRIVGRRAAAMEGVKGAHSLLRAHLGLPAVLVVARDAGPRAGEAPAVPHAVRRSQAVPVRVRHAHVAAGGAPPLLRAHFGSPAVLVVAGAAGSAAGGASAVRRASLRSEAVGVRSRRAPLVHGRARPPLRAVREGPARVGPCVRRIGAGLGQSHRAGRGGARRAGPRDRRRRPRRAAATEEQEREADPRRRPPGPRSRDAPGHPRKRRASNGSSAHGHQLDGADRLGRLRRRELGGRDARAGERLLEGTPTVRERARGPRQTLLHQIPVHSGTRAHCSRRTRSPKASPKKNPVILAALSTSGNW